MQALRKVGLVLSILLFSPLLILSVFSFSFNHTLGDKNYVKQTLKQAKVYSAVSDAVVDAAQGADTGQTLVTDSLKESLGANQIEQTITPWIDSTYSWLEGATDKPVFTIDLTSAKENFQNSLTEKLKQRAATLPACTTYTSFSVDSIDTIDCIPPGTDVDAVINDAVSRITNTADVFTETDLNDNNQGIQTPEISDAPSWPGEWYRFIKQGQWYFVAGSVLTAVGVVLLSQKWLGGLRKLSILLLVNGLVLLLIGGGGELLLGRYTPVTSVDITEAPVHALQEAGRIISDKNAWIVRNFGIAFAVVGLAGTIATSVVLSKNKKPESETPDTESTTKK